MLVDWLCQQKAISQFQADILDAGINGPFRFGAYRIREPVLVDDDCHIYAGMHELTGHPVLIEFIAGHEAQALKRWRQARKWVRQLRPNPHPNLVRPYEAVSIPEYRLVVSEFPRGKPLGSLLPDDLRVNWKRATDIAGQIASAAIHARRHGMALYSIMPELVWLGSRLVQIPPVFATGISPDESNDGLVNSLGRLWFRLILGVADDVQQVRDLEIPDPVVEVMEDTLRPGMDSRRLLKKIVKLGDRIREESSAIAAPPPRKTQPDYFDWLKRTPGAILATDRGGVDPTEFPFTRSSTAAEETDVPDLSTDESRSPVRKRKRSMLAPAVGSLAIVVLMTTVVVVLTIDRPNSTVQRMENVPEVETVENGVPDDGQIDPEKQSAKPPTTTVSNAAGNTIEDDGETLWETATDGEPLDFTNVPYSPALAFHARWSQLKADIGGHQTLKALGPELNRTIEAWELVLGVDPAEIDSVLVTLHTSDEFRYQPFTIVKLSRPYAAAELIAAWGVSENSDTTDDGTFYRGEEGDCYVLFGNGESVQQFAMGSEQLAKECLELRDVNVLSGSMKRLAEWSDRERHINVLFLTPAVFNDEGQKLMAGPLLPLNRQLSVRLDRSIRGGLLGIHFDSDAYLEMRLDSTVDLKPDAAQQHVNELIDLAIEFVQQQTESGSAPDYWQKVSDRYSAMLRAMRDNFRFGVEDRNLIGNCWLPGFAIHNIVAGTELFVSLGHAPPIPDNADDQPPATIEELLALPRDLSIATNPDLIVLLNNLQQEIQDDYTTLPFEFEIRLIGADLSKEGITQNQRPSDIEMKQQPLSKILTEIMVKANPDKNITGASDPNCKMVWVLETVPDDPGRKIIMITTRAAAAEKGYELPEDFR